MAEVKMPPRIARLKRDKRGYPVPWNVLIGTDGEPIFTANDSTKHYTALAYRLCPICGEQLGKYLWFVGGPQSAFDPNGWYFDLPAHKECAEYALQVCPHLAAKKYLRRLDIIDPSKVPGVAFVDLTIDPDRPVLFVAIGATQVMVGERGGGMLPLVRPVPPFQIQYWKEGVRLTEEEGVRLVREVFGEDWQPPERRQR